MSQDSDSGDGSEYETAIAASAFAIATLEEEEAAIAAAAFGIATLEEEPGKKSARNWLWWQNSGRISDSSTSSEDNDTEIAIAAATFAVATLKEVELEASPAGTKSTGDSRGGLLESGEESNRKPELVYSRPPANNVTNQNMQGAVKGATRAENKADAWEKSMIAKIRKRHEKQHNMIQSWENKKKEKARLRLDIRESRLNLRKERANHAYEREVAKIDMIATGAREYINEWKRKTESKVKEKANKIRSKGRVPVTCFCF